VAPRALSLHTLIAYSGDELYMYYRFMKASERVDLEGVPHSIEVLDYSVIFLSTKDIVFIYTRTRSCNFTAHGSLVAPSLE
jgi:hypothetical protein